MAAQKVLKLTDPLRYTLPAEGSFAAIKRASEQPYTFAMPAQVVPEQISAASATAGALALQRAITGYEILNVLAHSQASAIDIVDAKQTEDREKKLARRNELIDKLTGAWSRRTGEVVDGVEYQNRIRAAWDRNT